KKAEFCHRSVQLFHLNSRDESLRRDFDQGLSDPLLHSPGDSTQHDVAGIHRLDVGIDRQAHEFLLQFGLAQQIAQRGTQIIQLLDRSAPHLPLPRNVKPCRRAVGKKHLGTRLVVVPAHAAGLFERQRAALLARHSGSRVGLGKLRLQRLQVVIALINLVGDGVNVPLRRKQPRKKQKYDDAQTPKAPPAPGTASAGTVTLMVVVSDKGFACSVQLLRGIDKETDDDALAAVKNWTFKPATKDGRPVPVVVTVEVNYVMKDG